jgi:hypothetical protein
MTRSTVYPGATFEPIGVSIGRGSNGLFPATPLGLVLHCNAAHSGDLHDFEAGNLSNGPTSHLQVLTNGTVYQYIPLDWTSWCQTDGNNTYWSLESSGLATEQATPQQVTAIAGVLAFLHAEWGMPLQIADIPGQLGFGWHGMGAANGVDWGHALCPGVRKDQRPQMLALAAAATEETDMTPEQMLTTLAQFFAPGTGTPDHQHEGYGRIVQAVQSVVNPASLAAAILPRLPQNSPVTEVQLEAALRSVLGSLDGS